MPVNHFPEFAQQVQLQYNKMAENELYRVGARQTIWSEYLAAFPDGTNPIFKERTEHDCVCCRQFVRNLGLVVSIDGDQLVTVWDKAALDAPYPYNTVAALLATFVRSQPIVGAFRTKESRFGNTTTHSLSESGDVLTWDHFEGVIQQRHKPGRKSVEAVVGQIGTTAGVLRRGLETIDSETLATLIEVISADETAIYRAAEFLPALTAFQKLADLFALASNKDTFVWANVGNRAAAFKNTVISTLAVDIAEGTPLEQAVAKFESKVAPHNYKRPKALITQGMIDKALTTLDTLDLRESLPRRAATIRDVSVNDVLYVDRKVRSSMKDPLAVLLAKQCKQTKSRGIARDIAMDAFISDVLPTIDSLAVLFENQHVQNLIALTAPTNEDAEPLFKWGNGFAWTYNGGVADSIKQRVKKAGGDINADLRVSLAWFNYDDLDIHVIEPSGREIYYGNKCNVLDVDMNVSRQSREAIENLRWNRPTDGVYQIQVHNYTPRESIDVGFELEVESLGVVRRFKHTKRVTGGANHATIDLTVKLGTVVAIKMHAGIEEGSTSSEAWGISTGDFVSVSAMMLSPNHWRGAQHGNKHFIFALEGCRNPEPTRGMFNEYLRNDLTEHRKVFEILGAKMLAEPANGQLCGVGFSATQKSTVTVKTSAGVYNIAI